MSSKSRLPTERACLASASGRWRRPQRGIPPEPYRLSLPASVANDKSRSNALLALAYAPEAESAGDWRSSRPRLPRNGGATDHNIGNYAETRLWRSPPAAGDLLAIIELIIARSQATALDRVMGPLASPAGLSDPGQRADLFRQVVNHCDPESLRKSVLELMNVMNDPEHADDLPVTSALLRYALDRMEPGEADRLLITEAFMLGQFPGILARLLTDRLITSLGPLTSHFRDRVAAGEDANRVSTKWSHRCWAMAHNPDISGHQLSPPPVIDPRILGVIWSPNLGVFAVAAAGVLCALSCVVEALPGQCLRRRPGAFPLSYHFLELSGYCVNGVWLHVNAADVLVRCGKDRPTPDKRRLRGVRGWRLLRAFTFCSGPRRDSSMQFVGLPGGGTKLG